MPDIEIDASSLKGMTGDELAELFGPPIFSRRDRGSEILRFRGRDCLLDAFLYGNAGEADAAPWRVDHFETRDEDGRPVAVDDCLTDVALAHAASG